MMARMTAALRLVGIGLQLRAQFPERTDAGRVQLRVLDALAFQGRSTVRHGDAAEGDPLGGIVARGWAILWRWSGLHRFLHRRPGRESPRPPLSVIPRK